MSVQAVSRIAALLALDADLIKEYMPIYEDEDEEEDLNEENRAHLAHLYRHQLTDEEKGLISAGDLNAVFQYIADHLEKPVNGEAMTGAGSATGSGSSGSGGGG